MRFNEERHLTGPTKRRIGTKAGVAIALAALLISCGPKGKVDEAAAAPPPVQVVEQPDLNVVKVDHPERFTVVAAGDREDTPALQVTGSVNADAERSIPVISLASGRVVEIDAKLGDDVKKGQLLLRVLSDDVAAAFSNYKQAQADEKLAGKQLERAQLLYGKGAISLSNLELAEDAEQKAQAALDAAVQHIRTLGASVDHNDPVVEIRAPASGTIVEQNVVNASSVHTPDNQANLFTIADLSRVWIICDVYENDLPEVRLGDSADIRLSAYPDRIFQGTIGNIGKLLDPNIRAAKVRIEMANPGIMRAGMFVTATLRGHRGVRYATVPTRAVLHLHDRDWIFTPAGSARFRRSEITTGKIVDRDQLVLSGIAPGQQVVADALSLEAESEQ